MAALFSLLAWVVVECGDQQNDGKYNGRISKAKSKQSKRPKWMLICASKWWNSYELCCGGPILVWTRSKFYDHEREKIRFVGSFVRWVRSVKVTAHNIQCNGIRILAFNIQPLNELSNATELLDFFRRNCLDCFVQFLCWFFSSFLLFFFLKIFQWFSAPVAGKNPSHLKIQLTVFWASDVLSSMSNYNLLLKCRCL